MCFKLIIIYTIRSRRCVLSSIIIYTIRSRRCVLSSIIIYTIRSRRCVLSSIIIYTISFRSAPSELFSAPTLSMSPAEVFQKEQVRLTCRSESSAPERLDGEELVYTLDPPGGPLAPRGPGVFSGYALPYDFNYTCAARVKGIVKHSAALSVRPKGELSL